MTWNGASISLSLLAFTLGVGGLLLLPKLPDSLLFFAILTVPLYRLHPGCRPGIFFLVGFLWAFIHAQLQLTPGLATNLQGKDLVATGVIEGIPVRKALITRFEMRLNSLSLDGVEMTAPKRARLSWHDTQVLPQPGEIWRLKLRLKRPRGYQNPGGFDYERWLFGRGIQATGYVRKDGGNQRIGTGHQGGWLDRLRLGIGQRIEGSIEDPRAAALIRALITGDRGGLSDQDWDSFSRTGASHLVAISGLHIGMIAGLAFVIGHWLWRRSERLMLWAPAPRAGAVLALISAVCYAALAGFSLPTQRALLMLGLGFGALLMGRELSLWRVFTLALFGVVLIDPLAMLSAGFWLSFGAVAVILYAMNGRLRRPRGWRQWGRVQLVVMGLTPLLFISFNQASLVAPLVNLLLVPWFTFFLIPLLLCHGLLLSVAAAPLWLTSLAESSASATLWLLDGFAHLPHAVVFRPDQPLWVWVAAFMGVVVILTPKGMPGRYLGLVLLIPMLFNQPARLSEGTLLLTLLDVGQGLSAVVETADHVLVYDTGPAFPSGFNAAEAALIPYLRSRGIARIDRLILSNGDQDHAGGAGRVLDEMEVSSLSSGEPLQNLSASPCRMGDAWDWDGITFKILHPRPGDEFDKSNDRSCVVKLGVGGRWVLLPGDLEAGAERLMLKRHADELRADILIAPHHGSRTSSTPEFVARVAPAYVLFATGYRNRFGFPKSEVVERWRNVGAMTLDTASTGAIQFLIGDDAPLRPLSHRMQHPHLWSASHGEDE